MMGREAKFRKTLSMPGLLAQMRRCFEGVEDEVAGRGLSLADCLMSGLAIFSLKYPSLLQFEQDARGLGESAHEPRRENLRSLFGVERAPSDVRLRERLDEVDPRELRAPFKRLFARAQRGGALAGFEWLEGRYLLSVDGTGHFSSSKVHCANCCERRHKDGTTTYYHQSLCAVLVHPQRREVVPVVAPEAIVKSDGRKKNDCERRAAKRLLTELRREHPHLALVVVEDGLASNGLVFRMRMNDPGALRDPRLDAEVMRTARAFRDAMKGTQGDLGAMARWLGIHEQGLEFALRQAKNQISARGNAVLNEASYNAQPHNGLYPMAKVRLSTLPEGLEATYGILVVMGILLWRAMVAFGRDQAYLRWAQRFDEEVEALTKTEGLNVEDAEMLVGEAPSSTLVDLLRDSRRGLEMTAQEIRRSHQ